MAVIFDPDAYHCRVWGIPIPFCYERPSGNVEPGGQSPDAGVNLGLGGTVALVVVGLVVVFLILGRLAKIASP